MQDFKYYKAIHIHRFGNNLNRDPEHLDNLKVHNKLLALDQNQSISVGQSGQVAVHTNKLFSG